MSDWNREELVDAAMQRHHKDPLFHARAHLAADVALTEPRIAELRWALREFDLDEEFAHAIRFATVVATHTAESQPA